MFAPIIAIALIITLVVREIVSGIENDRAKNLVRTMNVVLLPLLVLFLVTTVAGRIADLFLV